MTVAIVEDKAYWVDGNVFYETDVVNPAHKSYFILCFPCISTIRSVHQKISR